jgi:hypothetical protein
MGYTDDSDVRLAVLHASFASLEDMRRAKKDGRDLKVRVFWKGVRTRYRGVAVEVDGSGAFGSSSEAVTGAKKGKGKRKAETILRSSAWGTSHDGGCMQIVGINWVEKGLAQSLHRPNRKTRMAQYAIQRKRMNLLPSGSESTTAPGAINKDAANQPQQVSNLTRNNAASSSPDPPSSISSSRSSSLVNTPKTPTTLVLDPGVEIELEEGEAERARLSVVFGFGQGSDELGITAGATGGGSFVYEPNALRSAFFSEEPWGRPVKKRRIEDNEDEEKKVPTEWSMILENEDERYVVAPSLTEQSSTTYTLSVIPTSTTKPAAKPDTSKTSAPQVLAQGLRERDVEFVEGGMFVWIVTANTNSLPSSEVKMDIDAVADIGTSGSLSRKRQQDGERKGWFCRVDRWRYMNGPNALVIPTAADVSSPATEKLLEQTVTPEGQGETTTKKSEDPKENGVTGSSTTTAVRIPTPVTTTPREEGEIEEGEVIEDNRLPRAVATA